ncbi:MAG: DivIVA domain-containing protein [Dermabacter sp.]|nr:DivIVA domain-containing protein [Dermabacter sp.]
MALMPEDLENKRFTPVRFTEGYDMDEVDNYLDNDVMPRLKELIEDNERLARELEQAQTRISELESQDAVSGDADYTPAPFTDGGEVAVSEETVAVADVSDADQAASPAAVEGQSATELIALAQRLHDEHVRNGEQERERLISEATSEHERIINEANETSRTTLEQLEAAKGELEKDIESLRTFERDYRTRLRNYLENQLRDLDTSETQEKAANYGL